MRGMPRGDPADSGQFHIGGGNGNRYQDRVDSLIPTEAIDVREPERIRERAQRFIGFVNDARCRLTPQKESVPTPKTAFRKLDKQTHTE
jgi:hypothetical protein